MQQNWLILLPEISLLAYVIVAIMVNRWRETKTPKTFFTLSKVFLSVAIAGTVIFYNKSPFPELWRNTRYTALFKVIIYLVALTWFYLSSKWFLVKSRPSFGFYTLTMLNLLLFGILLSARNLLLPAIIVPLLCLINFELLNENDDKEETGCISRLYVFFATLFVLLLWGGIAILHAKTGSYGFAAIEAYLSLPGRLDIWSCAAIGMILASWLFMLALAPFHSWFVSFIGAALLPVSGFLTLLPPFVFLACLISLMTGVFHPALPLVKNMLTAFALISLLLGALSANGEKNVRRLFAFSTLFNLGFMLFSIVSFSDNAVLSAFSYTMIYVLAMAGVYTVFLGMKSRGEYLSELGEINGLSESKPYISAALLIFMFSMIGIPPMLGFLGRLSIVNNLVIEERWPDLAVLLTALMFMANAYLQVIRTIYFEPLKNSFDRTDKAIYICLAINLVLVVISILNPGWLLHDAEKILPGAL